jgi:hypothetical protein
MHAIDESDIPKVRLVLLLPSLFLLALLQLVHFLAESVSINYFALHSVVRLSRALA